MLLFYLSALHFGCIYLKLFFSLAFFGIDAKVSFVRYVGDCVEAHHVISFESNIVCACVRACTYRFVC